jgi:exosortase
MTQPTGTEVRGSLEDAQARGSPRAPVVSRLATIYGLWIAVAALYWPSALALNALWTNPAQEEAFTHGYLVLLIALWLVWRERQQLAATPVRPQPLALGLLVLLSALWLWCWRAAIQEFHMMLLPLILLTAIAALLGTRAARVLVFPVGYLYFAMPFWSDGNFLLQGLSSKMVGVLVWLTGVPAFMQGNVIELPHGAIRIAGGCSGLHSFIVGLALAALYGKLFDLPLRRRLWAIALMGALALIVNWIRIFIVTAVAYFTHMHSSLVRNHYWLGWWLFACVFAAFLWWMERKPLAPKGSLNSISSREVSEPSVRARIGEPRQSAKVFAAAIGLVILIAFGIGLLTLLGHNYYHHYWIGGLLCIAAFAAAIWWVGRNRLWRRASSTADDPQRAAGPRVRLSGIGISQLAVTFLALAALPVSAYAIDWSHSDMHSTIAVQWPAAPAGWTGPARAYATVWHPVFRDAGGQSLRQYTNARGATVQVFAVAYREQTQHAKLLGYWNRLLGTGHALSRESLRIVTAPSGRWRQLRVRNLAGMRSLIWSRYRIGARTFVAPRLSQLWYGLAALIDPPLSSLRALRTACVPDCAAARRRLAAAAGALRPRFVPGQ